MTKVQLEKYAALILYGVGNPNNKKIHLTYETPGQKLARTLADLCYKKGATLVYSVMNDQYFNKSLIENGNDKALNTTIPWIPAMLDEIGSEEWIRINIAGSEDHHLLAGLSQERSTTRAKTMSKIVAPYSKKVSTFQIPWIIVMVPTVEKAKTAFPDLPDAEAFEKYEQAVIEVLKLNEDSTAFWKESFANLAKRKDEYTEKELTSIHFEDPSIGTDLRIGLIPGSRWATAEETLPSGKTCRVNIPSCEVFCCPDYRTARGRVQITKDFIPVRIPGEPVKGAWVEFENGKVVKYGADQGEEVLKSVISLDEQAHYLGEVALVDKSSPVASQNFLFHNILYDENASCHIAFGFGFPSLVEGMIDAEKKDLLAKGINQSFQHQDVMIGSPNMKVTATDKEGKKILLMKDGSFV